MKIKCAIDRKTNRFSRCYNCGFKKFETIDKEELIDLLKVVGDRHHGVDACVMVSFNYSDKKARDVGLTCRCHLSNIMSDSILYDSMEWGITYFLVVVVVFVRVITTVFLLIKEIHMDAVVLSL